MVRSPYPLAGLTFLVVGAVIVPRQPHNGVGWLFVSVGLITGVVAASAAFGELAPMWWLNQWLPGVAFGLLPLALLLFPDGRLPSPGWRLVFGLGVAGIAVSAVGLSLAVALSPRIVADMARPDPSGGLATAAFRIGRLATLTIPLAGLAAFVALVVRWRRTSGDVRQQIKVLSLGALAIPVSILVEIWGLPDLADLMISTAVPVAAGAAILKYRLYDLDVFINRSLVYSILTIILVGVYAVTASVAGSAIGAGSGSLVVATGVVTLLFQPLRDRVQRAVGSLLYGDRDDPYVAVTRLNRILEPATEPERLFSSLAEAVTSSLRLPYAGIETIRHDGTSEMIAEHGRSIVAPEVFAMIHNGQAVGRLMASPRTVGGAFNSRERELLDGLALQAAAAVRSVQLTADLRASRARLVRAREDERIRLRRDLHDGLGPSLAGAAMQVAATRSDLTGTSAEAFGRVEEMLSSCILEIREIVQGLRPAPLDALGLVPAIRQCALGFSGVAGTPRIEVAATDDLPGLPAAVEVAAYRITTEAITNVVRHAGATWCAVTLRFQRDLELRIEDDGTGISQDARRGMGLDSMRERSEELGGEFAIKTGPRGTTVSASLPVEVPA